MHSAQRCGVVAVQTNFIFKSCSSMRTKSKSVWRIMVKRVTPWWTHEVKVAIRAKKAPARHCFRTIPDHFRIRGTLRRESPHTSRCKRPKCNCGRISDKTGYQLLANQQTVLVNHPMSSLKMISYCQIHQ